MAKKIVTDEHEQIIEEVKRDVFLGKCGHVNKQFVNVDGVREDLACTLASDHSGDHEADYQCLRPVDGSIAQAKIIAGGKKVLEISRTKYLEVTERAYWSNAAGTLASDVHPDLEQLKQIKAQKGNMLDEAQIKRNANLA